MWINLENTKKQWFKDMIKKLWIKISSLKYLRKKELEYKLKFYIKSICTDKSLLLFYWLLIQNIKA